MAEILARCGYRCDLCPGYKDNIKNDDDRLRTSEGWFKHFGFKVPPEEINCQGCPSGECLDKDCPVRPCAEEKDLAHCALCTEFPCDKLESRMCFLDRYREKFGRLAPGEYERFFEAYDSKERLLRIKEGKGRV